MMEDTKSDQCREWLSLPSDIVRSITTILPIPDRIRSRSVCRSWFSAIPHVELSSSPWFVIPRNDGFCTLHSLSTNENFSFSALPDNISPGINIVGSQYGCIIGADQLLDVHVINPFSGVHYKLPPLSTLPEVQPVHTENADGSLTLWGFRDTRLSEANFCYQQDLSLFNHYIIRKVVMSCPDPKSDDFIALGYKGVAMVYTKAVDNKWTSFEEDEYFDSGIDDIMFHAGKFYRLTQFSEVLTYDFSESPTQVAVVAKAEEPVEYCASLRYLAFSKTGELLIVYRNGKITRLPNGRLKYPTVNCLVMRLKLGQVGGHPYWDVVDNLGDESLFLGYNNAMTVSDVLGIQKNCIYFTDTVVTNHRIFQSVPREKHVRDLVIFDMEKEFEQFYPSEFCLNNPAPIWLEYRMPN